MRPYGRQLFICIDGDCADEAQAAKLSSHFFALAKAHGLTNMQNPHRTKCTLSDCLGVCSGGPIVAVYPDGIWYHHVDEALLERIFTEHLVDGRIVEDHVFHRLYSPGQEPSYAPATRGDGNSPETDSNPQPKNKNLDGIDNLQIADETISPPLVTTSPTTPTVETKEESAARRSEIRRRKKKKGLVIVNTGDGKGKTTAALGLMTRAWGRKMRVGMLQFLKHENANFGEIRAARRMDIDWIGTGDGWTWTSKEMDETQARALRGWQVAQQKITEGNYDVFVMDEFTYPLHYGWLDTREIIDWLKDNKPPMQHLIITGRYAPPALVEFADLVTEMRAVKHPYNEQGIRAQPGVEF